MRPASRTSTISVCAIALVFRLTTNASFTTGFDSWSTSWPGDVRTKIATIGSSRNASATSAAATYATTSALLRTLLLASA